MSNNGKNKSRCRKNKYRRNHLVYRMAVFNRIFKSLLYERLICSSPLALLHRKICGGINRVRYFWYNSFFVKEVLPMSEYFILLILVKKLSFFLEVKNSSVIYRLTRLKKPTLSLYSSKYFPIITDYSNII